MINVGVLLPSCKDLVSTSVHLTPFEFHEGLRRCFRRKLLERVLADNLWVGIYPISHSFLFDELHIYNILLFGSGLTIYCSPWRNSTMVRKSWRQRRGKLTTLFKELRLPTNG